VYAKKPGFLVLQRVRNGERDAKKNIPPTVYNAGFGPAVDRTMRKVGIITNGNQITFRKL
jgi:hypothetical protein